MTSAGGAGSSPAYRLFLRQSARLRRERATESALTVAAIILLFVICAIWTGFSPAELVDGLPRIGQYFGKLFSIAPDASGVRIPVLAGPHLFGGVREPQSFAYWFYRLGTYLRLLAQTVQMAVLSTAIGFGLGFLLSFPATPGLGMPPAVTFVTRRGLEFVRSIPQVVLAFILVWPFGIGPLAGIMAIAIHTTGALGKLFSELNDNADPRPMQGIASVGAGRIAVLRYGLVPQVLPGFLSYGLLRFEINVRSSTIIGFVGAGGIGQELQRVISFNIYEEVSAIVLLILLLVTTIDLISERLRHRFIGRMGEFS